MGRSRITKPLPGVRIDYSHPHMQDLAGWWMFNEGAGKRVNDYSFYGNHGLSENQPAWKGSPFGGALDFVSGSSHRVVVPDHDSQNPSTAITCCAWVWTDSSVGGIGEILAKFGTNKSYLFWVAAGDSTVRLFVDDNGSGSFQYRPTSNSTVTSGKWHHVAAAWESNVVTDFYIDGVYAGVTELGTNITTIYDNSGQDLEIGAEQDGAFFATGRMDDVRLYKNRKLTEPEIQDIYMYPYAPVIERKISYFFVDTGTGATPAPLMIPKTRAYQHLLVR